MTPNNDSSRIIYDAEARGGGVCARGRRYLPPPFKIYNYVVIPPHFPLFPYHLQNCANLRGRSCFIIGVQPIRNYLLSRIGSPSFPQACR